MNKNTIVVMGSRGMDASNLIAYLLRKGGYNVIGTDRRSSSPNYWRHKGLGIEGKFHIETMDVTDYSNVSDVVNKYKPEMIFNLSAMSFVADSFHSPIATFDINANGQLNVLEAVRKFSPDTKIYFAATSEMFGKVQEVPQSENTPFYPRSPYGCSKLAGFWLTKNYRESYNLFACSGILFNHEGVLRGEEFVTRKITQSIAKWYYKKIESFELGNLDALRDWGDSEDYVIGALKMLQVDKADDYILATGIMHSVREFITECFDYLQLNFHFEGEGVNEKLYVEEFDDPVITISKKYYRPSEVDQLQGNYTKAKTELGWEPRVSFKQLVHKMMQADLDREAK